MSRVLIRTKHVPPPRKSWNARSNAGAGGGNICGISQVPSDFTPLPWLLSHSCSLIACCVVLTSSRPRPLCCPQQSPLVRLPTAAPPRCRAEAHRHLQTGPTTPGISSRKPLPPPTGRHRVKYEACGRAGAVGSATTDPKRDGKMRG